MLSLQIDDNLIDRLEKFIKEAPEVAESANKKALKRAIQEVKKFDLNHIHKKYTADEVKITTSARNGEGTLKALSKRNSLDNFAVSLRKPGRSADRLSTTIIKGNKKQWTTLFWAFYKGNGVPRLMKRHGHERHKISNVTAISNQTMGIQVLEIDFISDHINKIYNEELLRGIERYGY